MKLTEAQKKALDILQFKSSTAYNMGVSLGTLNALSFRGLVRLRNEPGAMAFPRTARWDITEAGRSALAAPQEAAR